MIDSSARPASPRRTRPRLHVALALVSLLAPASTPSAAAAGQESLNAPRPQQVPRFDTAVEVIRIQAMVRDDDGRFVSGLGPDDFELVLDGVVRPVIDVLEMRAGQLMRADAGGGVAPVAETLPFGSHRQFLLFLDMTDPTPTSFRNARSTARDFIDDTLQPGDRLGLALYSAFAGVIFAVPFTADHAQVDRALESMAGGRLVAGTPGVGEDLPLDEIAETLGVDAADLLEEAERTRYAMVAEGLTLGLQQLAADLSVIQGRKHVLFFSRGMSDGIFGSASFLRSLEAATESLRAADTVLYTLQPDIMRGITAHDPSNMQSTRQLGSPEVASSVFLDRTLLHNLAEGTGGDSFWFRHRLRKGLEEVEERTRDYYAIAFQVRGGDAEISDIELRVRGAGRVVDAPARLALPQAFESMSATQRYMRLAAAVELGEQRDDLAMSMAGLPLQTAGDRRRIAVFLQIPGSELAALAGERGDARVEIEVLGLAIGPSGNIVDAFQGRATSEDITAIVDVPPLRYVNEVQVPAGSHHVKLLVREKGTDAMSVRSLRFDALDTVQGQAVSIGGPLPVAPAGGAPYLWAQRSRLGADQQRDGTVAATPYPLSVADVDLAPDLDDVVTAAGIRDFYLRVQNLQMHPFNRNVEWSMRLEVIGADNRVVELEPEIALFDDRDPADLRMLLRVPFGRDLAVGPNELTVTVFDRLSGATAESRWDFTVLPR